jgi:hypothetical protein
MKKILTKINMILKIGIKITHPYSVPITPYYSVHKRLLTPAQQIKDAGFSAPENFELCLLLNFKSM